MRSSGYARPGRVTSCSAPAAAARLSTPIELPTPCAGKILERQVMPDQALTMNRIRKGQAKGVDMGHILAQAHLIESLFGLVA